MKPAEFWGLEPWEFWDYFEGFVSGFQAEGERMEYLVNKAIIFICNRTMSRKPVRPQELMPEKRAVKKKINKEQYEAMKKKADDIFGPPDPSLFKKRSG